MTLFDITWRNCPPYRDLIGSMSKFIAEIDCSSGVESVYLPIVNSDLVKLHDATSTTPRMMRRERTTRFRGLPTSEGLIESLTEKDAAFAYYIAMKMMEKMTAKVSTYRRALGYELAMKWKGLSDNKVDSLLDKLALTLNLHPYCLGIKSEWKSQVYVPVGCVLDLQVVEDIFEYSEGNKGSWKTFGQGSHHIPGMINSLAVKAVGKAVRAVIVTEHRNIKAYEQHMSGATGLPGLEGTMLVMLGGFADFAAREFLNLLYRHPSMAKVRFLWLSDGDASGLTMFTQCKFGSRCAAYASPTMICPSLQYCGMTLTMLEEQVTVYAQRQIAHSRAHRPNMDQTEEEQLVRAFRKYAEDKRGNILKVKAPANKEKAARREAGIAATLNSLADSKYLDGTKDKLAADCLKALQAGQAPLALSCVNQLDPHGVLYALRDAVAAAFGENFVDIPVVYQNDHVRQVFAAAGSQNIPVANTAEEDREMLDVDIAEAV